MNRLSILLWITIAFLQSCGAIKGAFPDKAEDYKKSKELPALEVPPDLTTSSIDDPAMQKPDASGSASYTELLTKRDRDKINNPAESDPDKPVVYPSNQLASESNGVFLKLNESFPKAWRLIGKALSNLEIEVADRNRSIGMYYILFQDEKPENQKDKSFWSQLAFWRDVEVKERGEKYQVKLEEWGETTKVFVLDSEGKKQSDGLGLSLLKKIEKNLAGT